MEDIFWGVVVIAIIGVCAILASSNSDDWNNTDFDEALKIQREESDQPSKHEDIQDE